MNIRVKGKPYCPQKLPYIGNCLLQVNSRYFTIGGEPCLPVMGEFHFSRYPAAEWKRELEKMRSGGIQIVATYVFWIHHEEEKGNWDFSGSRDLRRFVETCREIKMPIVLRIGPFAHGECRNGGLPDWIVRDPQSHERTNDPEYLTCVKAYFTQIGNAVRGMLWSEGGPLLGIQIENEYGHVGGPSDDPAEGISHMHNLKQIANDCGLEAPFYTATGWGGAYIAEGEMLPVHGGYCDAPWEQSTRKLPASRLYMLEAFMDDGGTGSDWQKHKFDGFRFDQTKYPFLTAELGGGLQVTHHRRTYPTAADVEAMVLGRLAAGANMLGYYMYHGGVNPDGHKTTLQESRATGYSNDLPIKSYDFFAPLGESGEPAESYHALKKLHMFVTAFGDRLAPCQVVEADEKPASPEDTDTLRISLRHDFRENSGFLFICNHVRGLTMKAHRNAQICAELPGGERIAFPRMDILPGDCRILPYNFRMGDAVLRATNAQPLCKLGETWVFCCDEEPVYDFACGKADILTLTKQEAEHAYLIHDRLYISKDAVLYEENGTILAEGEKNEFDLVQYAADLSKETLHFRCEKADGQAAFAKTSDLTIVSDKKTMYDGDFIDCRVTISYPAEKGDCEDLLLAIDFGGDRCEVYDGERLIADRFATGTPWHLALKRSNYPTELKLRIFAPTEPFYHDLPIDTEPCLKDIRVLPIYRIRITNG